MQRVNGIAVRRATSTSVQRTIRGCDPGHSVWPIHANDHEGTGENHPP